MNVNHRSSSLVTHLFLRLHQPEAATSTFAGGSTQVMELRSTMSITRRWVIKAPNVPGSYRLKLVYYNSPNTQTTPVTIYSPTFEVQ